MNFDQREEAVTGPACRLQCSLRLLNKLQGLQDLGQVYVRT